MARKPEDADMKRDVKTKPRSNRRALKPDEEILWQSVAQNVRPLSKPRIKSVPALPAHAEPAQNVKDVPRAKLSPVEGVVEKRVRRTSSLAPAPLLEPQLKRKLKRGQAAIEARLDLHGLTQAKARPALVRFIEGCRKKDLRTVLVITGKGKSHSAAAGPSQGVLRAALPGWLFELSESVVAFEAATPAHGGEGAYYLRLRARKRAIK